MVAMDDLLGEHGQTASGRSMDHGPRIHGAKDLTVVDASQS